MILNSPLKLDKNSTLPCSEDQIVGPACTESAKFQISTIWS